jgi:hypothetical protein
VEETLVVEFTPQLASLTPEEFADAYLRPIGTEVIVAGEDFRFGRRRAGDVGLLGRLGYDGAPGRARSKGSRRGRSAHLVHDGDVADAAALLGRPVEVEGSSSRATRAGRHARVPDRRTCASSPDLLVPAFGIYAVHGRRASRGSLDRREPALRRRRAGVSRRSCSTSRATSTGRGSSSSCGDASATSGRSRNEQELIDQICCANVEQTRAAVRPVVKQP